MGNSGGRGETFYIARDEGGPMIYPRQKGGAKNFERAVKWGGGKILDLSLNVY